MRRLLDVFEGLVMDAVFLIHIVSVIILQLVGQILSMLKRFSACSGGWVRL